MAARENAQDAARLFLRDDSLRAQIDVERPSRTKPARVIPNRMAVSTARLDGAPTAAKTLIPH